MAKLRLHVFAVSFFSREVRLCGMGRGMLRENGVGAGNVPA